MYTKTLAYEQLILENLLFLIGEAQNFDSLVSL